MVGEKNMPAPQVEGASCLYNEREGLGTFQGTQRGTDGEGLRAWLRSEHLQLRTLRGVQLLAHLHSADELQG